MNFYRNLFNNSLNNTFLPFKLLRIFDNISEDKFEKLKSM